MTIQTIMPNTDRRFRYCSPLTMALALVLFASVAVSDAAAQATARATSAGRGNVTQAGQYINNGQAYQVMQASQVPTAADRPGSIGAAINGQGTIQQVGCQSCGTSCGGSCGAYSAYGESFGDYGSSYACGNNACGVPCDPYCYAMVEGLYMEREDAGRGLSRNFGFDDYDYEWASRITIGSLPNCVNGYEMTLVTPIEWNTASTFSNAGGGLGTIYGPPTTPSRTLFLSNIPAFEDMTTQTQSLEAEYWSIEGNRTLVGWDVAKILIGGRYIEYDETMVFSGVNTAAQTALAASTTQNRMVGGQIGLDLLYPVGLFAYSDFRARAGIYYNNAEADFQAINEGVTQITTRDTSGGIAGVFELGSGIRYQLGEMLSVRAGTEMWYVTQVASAATQPGTVSYSLLDLVYQSSIDDGSDFFVFGFNLGAELKY